MGSSFGRIDLLTVAVALGSSGLLAAGEPDAAGIAFFEKKIRPVLVAQCYECHSAAAVPSKKLKGELQLDTRADIRQRGANGPAVVAGDPAKGTLLAALRHETFEMPPKGRLPDETIADFAKWIELGAPDPRDGQPVRSGIDYAAARGHWAYRPVRRPTVPAVKDAAWPRGDVDRFVLPKIEGAGLRPAADVAPQTLLRRPSFDLVDLPPTPAELDAFLAAQARDAEDAIGSAVDRLLAALLADLRRTDLLDSTLVLWGGEFGRTPTMQSAAGDSRAHHTHGYTMWLAGGGTRRGYTHGETDELGRDIVRGKVHVHDLHATIPHLMGLDHERLTYRHGGREQRLTDVHGRVVRDLIA